MVRRTFFIGFFCVGVPFPIAIVAALLLAPAVGASVTAGASATAAAAVVCSEVDLLLASPPTGPVAGPSSAGRIITDILTGTGVLTGSGVVSVGCTKVRAATEPPVSKGAAQGSQKTLQAVSR